MPTSRFDINRSFNIFSQQGPDVSRGFEGKDDVRGGDGQDALFGGNDNDELYGDHGNDNLDGGDDTDWVYDEAGSDYDDLCGGAGSDLLDAFDYDGHDEFYYAPEVDGVAGDKGDDRNKNVNCPF